MEKAFDKLLKFASLRPRSEKEIHDWFKRKKIDESMQKTLFNQLNDYGLIDDYQFALWWIDQRLSFRPKGKRALNQELRIKGIDKEIIERVLKEAQIDEVSIAKKLLDKHIWRWERFEKRKKDQKMAQFLLRRGFDWEVVKKVKYMLGERNDG